MLPDEGISALTNNCLMPRRAGKTEVDRFEDWLEIGRHRFCTGSRKAVTEETERN